MAAAREFWCLGVLLHQPSLHALPRPISNDDTIFGFRLFPFGNQPCNTSPHFHETGFDTAEHKTVTDAGFYAVQQPLTSIVCDIGREQFASIVLFKGTPDELYSAFWHAGYDWNRLIQNRWHHVYLGPDITPGVIPISRIAEFQTTTTGTYGH